MDRELRQMLDEVEAQLATGEERLAAAQELIDSADLFTMLDEDFGENQSLYAPPWVESLAEPFFIPQGRNELDALFDSYDDEE